MILTMHEAGGIGLAAQQVGRAVQVCVVDLRASEAVFDWELDGAKPPLELFMPMVRDQPGGDPDAEDGGGRSWRGCLSFPGDPRETYPVRRRWPSAFRMSTVGPTCWCVTGYCPAASSTSTTTCRASLSSTGWRRRSEPKSIPW